MYAKRVIHWRLWLQYNISSLHCLSLSRHSHLSWFSWLYIYCQCIKLLDLCVYLFISATYCTCVYLRWRWFLPLVINTDSVPIKLTMYICVLKPVYTIKVFVISNSCAFVCIDLDSKDVLIGQFPSESVKVFRKIGWVSIPSKSIKVLWQSFWCRFTRSKNFDQVFDGKLWAWKCTFMCK